MGAKKRTASYEKLVPDVRYNSLLVSKFINCLMWDGKKSVATRVFYQALDQIRKRMPDADPLQIFTQAVENVKPTLEVRSRRVGGANYQVPMQVKPKRAESLAIRWIIQAVRAKTGRPTYLKLADELLAAYQRQGDAMAKREQTIKMAEANKAFSHFAWRTGLPRTFPEASSPSLRGCSRQISYPNGTARSQSIPTAAPLTALGFSPVGIPYLLPWNRLPWSCGAEKPQAQGDFPFLRSSYTMMT